MNKIKFSLTFVISTILILNIYSNNFAQERREHRERERVVVKHNDAYKEVIVKEKHYFFRKGIFYERGPNGYVIVTAPIGAGIDVLPIGCKIIRVRKVKYYFFGGVYYRFFPRKNIYVVVEKPL